MFRQRYLFFPLVLLLLATLACAFSADNGEPTSPPPTTSTNVTTNPPTPPITNSNGSTSTTQQPVVTTQLSGPSLELEQNLIQLYQRVNPSVVHILVYGGPVATDPLGSGTGFVYDTAGHIVTNNHVVESGEVFEIVFADEQRRQAEIIGRDVDSDLAIIKVDSLPEGVQPLPLGDSNTVQVGQFVVAIGNPFGEQSSMSMGIISGVNRSLESQRVLEGGGVYRLPQVIQTDAPINPGNSGGPLLNLNGEVLGVNSAIRSISGVNSGVGFAIPVNAVKVVVPDLIETGTHVYPFMGVQISDLNLAAQEQLDLPQVNGAYVIGVTPGGPAEDAGLIAGAGPDGRGGDLIVGVEGHPVNEFADLISYLVFETEVGQTIELTVIRNGETITVPLTLGERP
jgi:2-alkenal reductase